MVWCNASFARAVEAPTEQAAIDNGSELFNPSLGREAAEAVRDHESGSVARPPS